ncbi:MAG TPA: hypothetical protein DCO83_08945 [Mucilaginibacter sp.]|jgi:hypothetical protein|nr:hypothetical protein [Mucilaginibacter sp.]
MKGNITMETVSINKVLQLFNMLSKSEQAEVAEKIDMQTFEERWQIADKSLPDSELGEDDIMKEVRAIRYAGKKN